MLSRVIFAALAVLWSTLVFANTFSLVDTLDPDPDGDFGNHPLIDGDTVIVGWPRAFSGTSSPPARCGEVAIVERGTAGYAIKTTFTAPDCSDGDVFGGGEMALSGDLLAVSQPTGTRVDTVGSPADSAVHLFQRDSAEASGWSPAATLRASDQSNSQGFSGFIRISGDLMAVAGYTTETIFNIRFARTNAVYIFQRGGGGPGDWTQIQKLTTGSSTDFFGFSFDFSGNQLLVSAPDAQGIGSDGRVYVYTFDGSQFSRTATLPGVSDDNFGWYIDVDDENTNRAVITAIDLADDGAAYLFERTGDQWMQTQRFESEEPALNDLYGVYARLRGEDLAIGAENGKAPDVGRLYLYRMNGSEFTFEQSLEAPNDADGTFYASRFEFDGNQLAVSANGAQVDGGTTKFFLYEREGTTSSFAINPGVSGVWYNVDRDGEGVVMELLDNGTLNFYWYTYDTQGNQLWLLGTGTVDGDTATLNDLSRTSGPVFGAGFDTADLDVTRWGSASVRFDPDCMGAVLTYEGPEGYGSGSLALSRLAGVSGLGCSGGTRKVVTRSASGLFYDPQRSGEGIQVQILDVQGEQIPLLLFYSYDLDGQPIWIIATGRIEGDALIFDESTITTGARFGDQFDPASVQRSNFGSFSVDAMNCDSIEFTFESAAEGFPSASYTYQRLTQLQGALCN